MLSRKEFEELIVSDQVQNVTVIQNKNVPTGRVEIELEAEEGERGEVKNYYCLLYTSEKRACDQCRYCTADCRSFCQCNDLACERKSLPGAGNRT